jgi:hypothetical protein
MLDKINTKDTKGTKAKRDLFYCWGRACLYLGSFVSFVFERTP